jgi:hypothetical protein
MSNSRGTWLFGDGSGGVTGYGSRGSKKAVQPPEATSMASARSAARDERFLVRSGMAILEFAWFVGT